VDLNGHKAGNGGYGQRTPKARRGFPTRKGKVKAHTVVQKKYPDILTPIESLAPLPSTANWVSPLIEKLLLERAQLHLSLSDILNTHKIFLSQQIWVRMDPYRIYRALQRCRPTS
jgi:hypothetical protein